MKKKLITLVCILLVLSMMVGMLVACERQPDPVPPPPIDPDKPIIPDDPDPVPEEVAIKFVAQGVTNLSKYNGETGIGDDTYVAVLKGNAAVESGKANATVTIQSVTITLIVDGVPVAKEATAEEMAKFTLENDTIRPITTEGKDFLIRVKFGDFSDVKYYGAKFNIVLAATAMTVID